MATRKNADSEGPQSDGVNTEDEKAAGGEQVQAVEDKVTELGYRGEPTDPTPNEHYTFSGAAADKPTPETDEKQAAKVGSLKFR